MLWDQLQSTMIQHGCYQTQNSREVMEAILCKLRTGAPWRDIPKELCTWKTAYNRFNRWSKTGLWQNFFLAFEHKLIRNRYSPTEVIYGVISMQVELGLVKIEQLDKAVAEQLQRYIYPVMPIDIRSILKSLGVKSMTVKLQVNWLKWLGKLITLLLTKAMIQNLLETKFEAAIWYPSFLKERMPNSLIQSLIAIRVNCVILLKICSLDLSISAV